MGMDSGAERKQKSEAEESMPITIAPVATRRR